MMKQIHAGGIIIEIQTQKIRRGLRLLKVECKVCEKNCTVYTVSGGGLNVIPLLIDVSSALEICPLRHISEHRKKWDLLFDTKVTMQN